MAVFVSSRKAVGSRRREGRLSWKGGEGWRGDIRKGEI